jgi:uncharacterized protein YbjT (DUF2867 family)
VVVDVSNSPSFEDAAVLEFFETSTGNLLAAEAAAGVVHHVALSVVGTERLQESGYFRAMTVQEKLIEASTVAEAVARVALGPPVNGRVEVAGPERYRMDVFFPDALAARDDPREVVPDPHARYFGAELGERTLVPDDDATLGEIRYSDRPGRTAAGR